MSDPRKANPIPGPNKFIAVVYVMIAIITAASHGWQDTRWMGWVAMAAGFVLLGRVPEAVRRSVRETAQDRLGIVALAFFVIGTALLLLPLLMR